MKGDTTVENEDGHDGQAGPKDASSGERRPSIVKLQGMLKRVSQSPFHNQYRTLVPSASDSSGSSMNDSQNKQDGEVLSDLSAATADVPDDHQLHLGQNGLKRKDNHLLPAATQNAEWDPFHPSPQNGVNGGVARGNPFYAHFIESSSRSPNMEDVEGKTSEEPSFAAIFAPPPEFQSSPLDLTPEIQTFENDRARSPEPQRDLFQTLTHSHTQDLFRTSTLPQNTPANGSLFHDVTLNSPDLFKATPPQPQNPFITLQSDTTDLLKAKGEDLFQTATKEDLLASSTEEVNLFDTSPSNVLDPFRSPSNKEEDLFQSPHFKEVDPFHTPSTKEVDLFQAVPAKRGELFQAKENDVFQDPFAEEKDLFDTSSKEKLDIFSPSFTKTDDPFPSLITNDPFQNSPNVFDPFGTTPSKQYDPFQDLSSWTPDIFQPLPSKTQDSYEPSPTASSNDIFKTTPSNTASKTTYSTPSFNSPPEMTLDILSSSSVDKSPDLFKATPSHPAVHPNSTHEIVLTTPHGSKHDILQPTPFSQSRTLASSPSQTPTDLTHVKTFKRPPRPLPRTRPPRPTNPPKPANTPRPENPLNPANPTKPANPPRPANPLKPVNPPRPANPIEPELTSPKTPPKPAPKPLPKPVPRSRPTVRDNKPDEAENYAVFEDILLIGQERCVEDWPEDSPQLDPDFKPSGKFRLRRESLKIKGDSDGGSGEDQDGSGIYGKKKERKFRVSLLSRRGSKDKFPDDPKDGKSGTLRRGSKEKHDSKDAGGSRTLPRSLKDGFPDTHLFSAGDNEDEEQNGMDYKAKKPLKTKVTQLLRRASTTSSVVEMKHMNGHLPQGLKDDDIHKQKVHKKSSSIRRWSEGTVLDDSSEEEEGEGEEARHEDAGSHGFKRRKMVKIKFVPQRGFAISVEKTDEDLKGAHGHTPRRGSKEKPQDEVHGAHGYTPRKKSQDDAFEDVEGAKGYTPQSTGKAAFMDDEYLQKGVDQLSVGVTGDEDHHRMQDCRPKKPTKIKLLHVGRRKSKDDMLDDISLQKSSISAGEMEDEEQNGMEDCKPKNSKHKGALPIRRKSKTTQDPILHERSQTRLNHHSPQQASDGVFAEDDIPQKGTDLFSPGEMYKDEQDEMEYCKPKKPSKLKGFKKQKAKSKAMALEYDDPPGATSSDYYRSEAAEAEWMAAQMDERLAAGLEEGEEEGDTDSLMEWWNTVEQWDEVPSDDEDKAIKEDEAKSFTILAEKVHRGLRVFNKVFTERAEVLWQYVIMLHAIADDISNFHQKAKIASITGGTTTAVGGVTAIAGLALAPFTFGVSLVVTAVGVGVATAGGIASASATISDNVNNMHDRKKVETVLQDYEIHLLDIGKILNFVDQGLYRLRGHPFLRGGTQHYSEDWEVRRAVQMISLVDGPVLRASEVTDRTVASVQGLFKGMDKYFIKDSRELRKGCKKEVVAQIKEVANVLNDGLVELNAIREELQDANGNL
ncbi:uncharacterized protein LOC139920829 isoform X1 [Centroberyx gerrardi]